MKNLTKAQRKIYNSIMNSFPATSKKYAIALAKKNGVKFQFDFK